MRIGVGVGASWVVMGCEEFSPIGNMTAGGWLQFVGMACYWVWKFSFAKIYIRCTERMHPLYIFLGGRSRLSSQTAHTALRNFYFLDAQAPPSAVMTYPFLNRSVSCE